MFCSIMGGLSIAAFIFAVYFRTRRIDRTEERISSLEKKIELLEKKNG